MPIQVRIDVGLRIVFATPRGTLTHGDILAYQKSVWAGPERTGYHEIIDMTQVEQVAFVSPEWMNEIAQLSAGMDPPPPGSRLAIVALSDLHLGLARMYKSLREAIPGSTREILIFPTPEEALAWLTEMPAG